MTSFYTEMELESMGFAKTGHHVLVSRKASIYSPELIQIGNHVRIDDFCILSGEISIGSYVHISAYTGIYAKYGVTIKDFVTISGRNLIYSQNDDYSGEFMTNPMIPEELRNLKGARVIFEHYSILGAGCVVLPGVKINEGAAVGSLSLVTENLEKWKIYGGIPAKYIKDRKRNILKLINNL